MRAMGRVWQLRVCRQYAERTQAALCARYGVAYTSSEGRARAWPRGRVLVQTDVPQLQGRGLRPSLEAPRLGRLPRPAPQRCPHPDVPLPVAQSLGQEWRFARFRLQSLLHPTRRVLARSCWRRTTPPLPALLQKAKAKRRFTCEDRFDCKDDCRAAANPNKFCGCSTELKPVCTQWGGCVGVGAAQHKPAAAKKMVEAGRWRAPVLRARRAPLLRRLFPHTSTLPTSLQALHQRLPREMRQAQGALAMWQARRQAVRGAMRQGSQESKGLSRGVAGTTPPCLSWCRAVSVGWLSGFKYVSNPPLTYPDLLSLFALYHNPCLSAKHTIPTVDGAAVLRAIKIITCVTNAEHVIMQVHARQLRSACKRGAHAAHHPPPFVAATLPLAAPPPPPAPAATPTPPSTAGSPATATLPPRCMMPPLQRATQRRGQASCARRSANACQGARRASRVMGAAPLVEVMTQTWRVMSYQQIVFCSASGCAQERVCDVGLAT